MFSARACGDDAYPREAPSYPETVRVNAGMCRCGIDGRQGVLPAAEVVRLSVGSDDGLGMSFDAGSPSSPLLPQMLVAGQEEAMLFSLREFLRVEQKAFHLLWRVEELRCGRIRESKESHV